MLSRPASPCIDVCVLDADRCCIGCRRTMDEIVGWSRLDPAEQWAVIARLERAREDESRVRMSC